jgi:hypothetical protein
MSLVPTALKGYSVLAQDVTDLADGTARAFTVPGWPSPSYSPVIHHAPHPPRREGLDAIGDYLNHRWGAAAPATRLLVPRAVQPEPGDLPGGWHAEERPLHILVLETVTAPLPEVHDGLHVRLGSVNDAADAEMFAATVAAGFPGYPRDEVLRVLRTADTKDELVLVTSGTSDEPVATISVSVKGDIAFYNWGAVLPAHRGRRLFRLMEQVCLRRARDLGATHMVCVTRSPHVLGANRPHVEMWIYQNNPPSPWR